MDQIKIGKFISSCRKEKHITQEQLAEKLNISKNAVSKWERGICLMDIRLLKPLSEILEVTVNEILSGEHISKEKYMQQAEQNFIKLSYYNQYKAVFMGAIFLLCVIILLMIYSMIIGEESAGYTALLFGFSAFTFYAKYRLNKNRMLLVSCGLMAFSFAAWIIHFVLSTLQI